MKIKRILSLALSGVLALSMLAGCGFGGINKQTAISRTSTVISALNNEQKMLSYQSGDKKLDAAIAQVAGTMTIAPTADGFASSSIDTTVKQLTGYGDMGLGQWQAATTGGTYVKVFTYKVDDANSVYANAAEVAKDIASKLAGMKLNESTATTGQNVTNSYKGSVAAYETTIGEGDNAVTVWVVGVSVVQTVTANASSGAASSTTGA